MNVINMSKGQFERLAPLEIPREVFNTEAKMYELFLKHKEHLVLKSLFNIEGSTFANKLYTLEMLNANRDYIPDNFIIPNYLFTVNGHIRGFTMPKVNGVCLPLILNDTSIDAKEKIYYLKRIGEILENMKNVRKYTPLQTFFINDLHESNFMVEPFKKQVKVIDMDSSKIEESYNFPAKLLSHSSLASKAAKGKYQINEKETNPSFILADENSDLYCYTIIILNYLFNGQVNNLSLADFYNFLTYLKDIGLSSELIDIFSNLITNKHNENPSHLLDSITYEQIGRAKLFKPKYKLG